MRNSFWDLVWENLLKPSSAIAIILAIILWVFSPDEKITLRLALPIGALFIFFIFSFANVAYKTFKRSKSTLPRLLHARKPDTKNHHREKVVCLLEPSELFSYGVFVSFYYIGEENFEQLVGIGTVRNIQEDGKIQVVMDYAMDEHEDIIQKLAQNDAGLLKKIKVKPNILREYLDPLAFYKIFYGGEEWME